MLVYTGFELEEKHKEKLEKIAIEQHRSLAGQLRLVIEEWLEGNK